MEQRARRDCHRRRCQSSCGAERQGSNSNKHGDRLVYSNGIVVLSIFASLLIVVTGASVDALIPLYAIGVFISFTLSQSGMVKHSRGRAIGALAS